MKQSIITLFLLSASYSGFGQSLLVFTKTNGYRHESIETGMKTLEGIVKELDFEIKFSEDSLDINQDQLDSIDVLVFLSTSGDILNDDQQQVVEHFIKQGKGFVGIHGASATEYDWKWYGELVGRFFVNHPRVQAATVNINQDDPITQNLPKSMIITDEWYNFKTPFPESLHILMTLDESTYDGGTMGELHPVTWYHEFDGGRAFYTALGHTEETFQNEHFRELLKRAIKWTLNK
ncbi:MAG: ThuA domain-containing protein [Marinoscillum sp.]